MSERLLSNNFQRDGSLGEIPLLVMGAHAWSCSILLGHPKMDLISGDAATKGRQSTNLSPNIPASSDKSDYSLITPLKPNHDAQKGKWSRHVFWRVSWLSLKVTSCFHVDVIDRE